MFVRRKEHFKEKTYEADMGGVENPCLPKELMNCIDLPVPEKRDGERCGDSAVYGCISSKNMAYSTKNSIKNCENSIVKIQTFVLFTETLCYSEFIRNQFTMLKRQNKGRNQPCQTVRQ